MHAFKVTALSDGGQLNRVLSCYPVDLVVLDLALGREDGLDIVRNLTSKTDIPVIELAREI